MDTVQALRIDTVQVVRIDTLVSDPDVYLIQEIDGRVISRKKLNDE